MFRVILPCILAGLLFPLRALPQSAATAGIPGYVYHPMGNDPESWQRLTLWLGATYVLVAKEGQVDIDSCIHAASRSMGISRLSIVAEGIGKPENDQLYTWVNRRDTSRAIHLLAAVSGKARVQLLVLLGAFYVFEPHSYHRHRERAEHFLTRAIRESQASGQPHLGRQALALLVKLYAQGTDARADTLGNTLFKQCRQAGDKATEARALAYRSKYTPPAPHTIQRKTSDAQQAAALYNDLGDVEGEVNARTDLGYLQIVTRQLQPAYENHLLALQLAQSIHYPYTHYNTQALVTVTLFQGKFGEPLRYGYQTLRTAEATRDSLAWSYFYANLTVMYDLEGRYKEALEWAQKSVQRFVSERNTSVYRILNDVAGYLCGTANTRKALELVRHTAQTVGYPATVSDQFCYHSAHATCYIAAGLTDEAEKHIQQMDRLETLAEQYRGPMRRKEVTNQYAFLFLKRKQYRKAKEYFEKPFHSTGGMNGTLGFNITAYTYLILIDSLLGDHTAELAHYRTYVRLLDSSFRIARVRQAEELQVVYQMHDKEYQINSLTQQATLQKAHSEKSALIRNFSIAGIIATLIIAGLLYRQNRLRKRTNQVISQQNGQLQQLVADKEWLLKELHHRVKNNLQIIISLLDSQSEYINNEAALAAIEDNMRRIHAMALIHQKLYLTDDVSSIAMPEYINELVLYARDSFDTGGHIVFEQEVAPIDLDVSQAIPLGLIINESIVNSVKYAFPDKKSGIVRVQLHKNNNGGLVLNIMDNGKGLPEELNIKTHPSLGLNLMQGLTKQLNGSFSIENNNGLHITIRFAAINHQLAHHSLPHF